MTTRKARALDIKGKQTNKPAQGGKAGFNLQLGYAEIPSPYGSRSGHHIYRTNNDSDQFPKEGQPSSHSGSRDESSRDGFLTFQSPPTTPPESYPPSPPIPTHESIPEPQNKPVHPDSSLSPGNGPSSEEFGFGHWPVASWHFDGIGSHFTSPSEASDASDEISNQSPDEDDGGNNQADTDSEHVPPSVVRPASDLFDFIIEELDSDDSEWEEASVLQPYEIELPDTPIESLHEINDIARGLDLSNEMPSEDLPDHAIEPNARMEAFLSLRARMERQHELKRKRQVRMTSEIPRGDLSGSEDAILDASDVGSSSARRLRRRLPHSFLPFRNQPLGDGLKETTYGGHHNGPKTADDDDIYATIDDSDGLLAPLFALKEDDDEAQWNTLSGPYNESAKGSQPSITGDADSAAEANIATKPTTSPRYDLGDRTEKYPEILESNQLSWRLWLRGLIDPPAPEYTRVHFVCGCGDQSYLDVRELSPGGIEKFQQRLSRSARIAKEKSHDGSSSPATEGILGTPAPAHVRGSPPPASGSWYPHRSPSFNSISNRSTNATSQSSLVSSPPILQYLLVCINGKRLKTLQHIDLNTHGNDLQMFKQIKDVYKSIREKTGWRVSYLIPRHLRSLSSSISSKLPQLSLSADQLSFYRISSADFIRFQVIPIGKISYPGGLKRKELPPPEEVEQGRYLYKPVPRDDVEFFEIPLYHLLAEGEHLDNFWMTTFPKKLHEPLVRNHGIAGQEVIGWGIDIKEELDWRCVFLFICMVLFATGVGVVAYVAATSDASSAFGLGAYLVAMFTTFMAYQYFAWKDDLQDGYR